MINHESILLAARAKLEALTVATTTTPMSVTTAGFVRYDGSFVDDGYAPGMEIETSGFVKASNNGTFVLSQVTAGQLTVEGGALEAEAQSEELIANGAFDTQAGWTFGGGWLWLGDPNYLANCPGSPGGTLSTAPAIIEGVPHLLTFDISNYASAGVTPQLGGVTGTTRSANGTYAESIVAGAGGSLAFVADEFPFFAGSIDNVSLLAPPTATISASLPAIASENVSFEPVAREPYFREEYLPGPTTQVGVGQLAELEILPSYVLTVFVPSDTATRALRKYVDAILALFAPGAPLTVSGHRVTVRRDIAPFPAQVLQLDGWAFVTVTVPLRVRTANSI